MLRTQFGVLLMLGTALIPAGCSKQSPSGAPAGGNNAQQASAPVPLGTVSGVGIGVDIDRRGMFVSRVYSGSPAEQAGLKIGDHILQIDTHPTVDMAPELFQRYARGPVGTRAVIVRDTGNRTSEEIVITRAAFTVPTVTSRMLTEDIGLLEVESLPPGVEGIAEKAISELNEKGAKGLILDLRGTASAGPDTCRVLAEMLLPIGHPIWAVEKEGKILEPRITEQEPLWHGPIVAMISKSSGPANELLASAMHGASPMLKDRGPDLADPAPIVLVGKQTAGAIRLLKREEDADGNVRLAEHALFHTGDKQPISNAGVIPHKEVKRIDEFLDIAQAELQELMKQSK